MNENERITEIEDEEDWRPPIRFPEDDEDETVPEDTAVISAEECTSGEQPEESEESEESEEPEESEQSEEPEQPERVRIRKGEKKITSIGGQALIEGVMMNGPTRTMMVVRDRNGKLIYEEVKKSRKKSFIKKIPFIRGIFGFIDSMSIGMNTMTRSADLSGFAEEEEQSEFDKKLEKMFGGKLMDFLMFIASLLGIVLAVGLFVVLPVYSFKGIGWLCDKFIADSAFTKAVFHSSGSHLIKSVFEGVFRIIIFVVYIALISGMKEIRRVFEYHGAEHKSIFCYEAGEELTVENARKFKRFHPRCGTSFLIIMLLLSIIVGIFIPESFPDWLRILVKLACIPLIMGVGYELLKLCGRHDNLFTRIIAAPGMWMQRLTTKEPDDSQLECALEALIEVIPENQEDDRW